MKIDSARDNKIYLRNCGTGTVRNDSTSVYMDEAPIAFTMTPSSIGKGQIAEITLNSLFGVSIGNHKIRISNKAGEVERYVKTVLPDSCVLNLEFDEEQGNTAHDNSGYGNDGTLYNFNNYVCALAYEGYSITVSCPSGELIDSIKNAVYVNASSPSSCSNSDPAGFSYRYCDYANNCIGKNSCSFQVSNTICGGDPAPGYGKNLILNVSCSPWVNGKFGKALQFDGANDYVNISDSNILDVTNFTFEAWINLYELPTEDGNYKTIFDKINSSSPFWSYLFRFSPNAGINQLTVGTIDITSQPKYSSADLGNKLTKNVWHHVLGSFNGSTAKLYFDGNLEIQNNFHTAIPFKSDGPLWIGTNTEQQGGTGLFNGTIDNLRIYNKELTPVQTVSFKLEELT
jgi:hypothetical protein